MQHNIMTENKAADNNDYKNIWPGGRAAASNISYNTNNYFQSIPKQRGLPDRFVEEKEFSHVERSPLNVVKKYNSNHKPKSFSYFSLLENKVHSPCCMTQTNCTGVNFHNKCSIPSDIVDDQSDTKLNIVNTSTVKCDNEYGSDSFQCDTTDTASIPNQGDILLLRKQKNAERRQRKKQEKQQLKVIVSGVQIAKPDFSLEHLSDDFPSLNYVKKSKKVIKNSSCISNPTESTNEVTDFASSVTTSKQHPEKSWKPKINDPICFSLEQAIQSTNEKTKLIKKTEPDTKRAVRIGNMLDSDNPQLKKGKIRPDKEKKPSKLKEKILRERNERKTGLKDDNERNLGPISIPSAGSEGNDNSICNSIRLLFEKCSLCDLWDNTPTLYGDDCITNTVLQEQTFLDASVNRTTIKGNSMATIPQLTTLLNEDCSSSKTSSSNMPSQSVNIHSRKFREYCTNCLTEDLTTAVCVMLERVAYFQDRAFARDPIRATAKRRYVAGINQTQKYLQVNKVKLLVIAPDLEKSCYKGGLDEIIQNFVIEAKQQKIPCVFGPNRKRLGKAVFKSTLVSCVAVLSYEGAEDEFSKVLGALQEAKFKFQSLTTCTEVSMGNDPNSLLHLNMEESCVPADEITSTLLAALKEEVSPADKLLNALSVGDSQL